MKRVCMIDSVAHEAHTNNLEGVGRVWFVGRLDGWTSEKSVVCPLSLLQFSNTDPQSLPRDVLCETVEHSSYTMRWYNNGSDFD